MKTLISTIILLLSVGCIFGQPYQLSSPKITTGKILFSTTSFLDAELDLAGVELKYTMDGSVPTFESKSYSGRIIIDKEATIRIGAFHKSFIASAPVDVRFIKIDPKKKIIQVTIEGEISKDYSGSRENTLFDQEKGSSDFSDGKWLGFKGQDIGVSVKLKNPSQNFSILLSTMTNTGSWIVGPGKVELQVVDPVTGEIKVLDTVSVPEIESDTVINSQIIELSTELNRPIDEFKIVINQVDEVPQWHPGKHEDIWIFIDEIIIK